MNTRPSSIPGCQRVQCIRAINNATSHSEPGELGLDVSSIPLLLVPIQQSTILHGSPTQNSTPQRTMLRYTRSTIVATSPPLFVGCCCNYSIAVAVPMELLAPGHTLLFFSSYSLTNRSVFTNSGDCPRVSCTSVPRTLTFPGRAGRDALFCVYITRIVNACHGLPASHPFYCAVVPHGLVCPRRRMIDGSLSCIIVP